MTGTKHLVVSGQGGQKLELHVQIDNVSHGIYIYIYTSVLISSASNRSQNIVYKMCPKSLERMEEPLLGDLGILIMRT